MPLSPCLRVLDLCCGSGVIAVSLARRIPNLEAWAVDCSAEAASVTAKNAAVNGVVDRIHAVNTAAGRFLADGLDDGHADPARGYPRRFSAVVCNPPYIATADVSSLPPEVREHEPVEALDGGPDGLQFYRQIIPMLPGRLETGGFAAFEIGASQGEAVSAIMSEAGFTDVSVASDYAGLDRIVTGVRPA
jgi:release factor glutamine methyltransferase